MGLLSVSNLKKSASKSVSKMFRSNGAMTDQRALKDAYSLRRLRLAIFSLGSFLLLSLIAFIATPYDPMKPVGQVLLGPSLKHLLGTDHLGRDILSRLAYAAIPSLLMASLTILIAVVLGFFLGVAASYPRRRLTYLPERLIDLLFAFPSVLLALLFATIAGPSIWSAVLALAIAFVPSFARVVSAAVVRYRHHNFIRRIELTGVHPLFVILKQLLPLMWGDLLTACGIGMANALLAEATLSYLGLGLPATIPSYGRMLREAQNAIYFAPHAALAPGLSLVIWVLSFFLLGDGLSDWMQRREHLHENGDLAKEVKRGSV